MFDTKMMLIGSSGMYQWRSL